MILGVCYYPEHWPQARWAEDARQMAALGLQVARIGEFAWAKMEPAEGRFEWSWLDGAIETLVSAGLQVILGTPTAAPPAWLSRAYPDTLPVDEQGQRRNFGGRRHYCPNSPTYRRLSERIAAAMAERYAAHPQVIGWQIDNEFGGGNTARCYCPHCAAAFREWLKGRYGSLEALNAAWGNVFWSQTYSAWEQIEAPILVAGRPSPNHVLDYYRFSSDSVADYQALQVRVLQMALARLDRQPQPFITHNFMGLYTDLDYFKLAAPLTFATWDSYPTGNADRWRDDLYPPGEAGGPYAYDAGDPAITGMAHDLTRGLLGKPFWIMEQQPGHINWGRYNPAIRPGTVRLWTWQALAHGADGVVFFRWRAGLEAQEQFHAGLLHHDARPAVGYREVQALQAERELMAQIVRHAPQAETALLFDYEDLWALRLQPHSRDFGYLRHLFTFYRALQRLGIPVDVVSRRADLGAYKLVIAPTAWLVSPGLAESLAGYVRDGGMLLLGVRSGFKTPSNRVVDEPLPGLLRALTGIMVSEWHALPPGVAYGLETGLAGLEGPAQTWAEALVPENPACTAWARYTSGPLAGQAALSEHALGAGRAWYLGWYPGMGQAQTLAAHLAEKAGIARLAVLPEGVVAARRGPFTILMNFTDQAQQAAVHGEALQVGPRGVRVMRSG